MDILEGGGGIFRAIGELWCSRRSNRMSVREIRIRGFRMSLLYFKIVCKRCYL